ncbi:CBS domain-containing protein [Ancylomarina sp. 16SWW S1-10-2]|uniref:CBS domain-containing protein n=1 Tax=Ancylomarina sp. 16SWW S1-10-2 TaxID=2499681 RepID=UPI0012AD560A|nr:CBS domain-containing protein [Ancylomarina sp. 16SWW S1-10-2]MRT91421.1 CBS domain-containing protein [Ancylomarina sp. 16SWW S1-10-2]
MVAKDLISDVVPVLRESDTGFQALNWMEIFKVSHLPIVRDDEFVGLLSDNDIYDLNQAEETIKRQKLSLFKPFVTQGQHIYDVIEKVSQLKLTVIPVLLEDEKTYLGLITLSDLMGCINEIFAVSEPGGVIVLELNSIDYSLSEVAQIVESNDAKILSLYIKTSETSRKMELTIKINKTNLTSIIQTFHRYDYVIKSTYSKNDDMQDLLFDRYNSFMKFLNP